MIVTFTHRIEAPSVQKATALREHCAQWLEEQEDCTVISTAQAQDTQSYRVVGTQGAKPFDEVVEAESEDKARATAEGKAKSRVIALVLPYPSA